MFLSNVFNMHAAHVAGWHISQSTVLNGLASAWCGPKTQYWRRVLRGVAIVLALVAHNLLYFGVG
jgi:hypothetical protein